MRLVATGGIVGIAVILGRAALVLAAALAEAVVIRAPRRVRPVASGHVVFPRVLRSSSAPGVPDCCFPCARSICLTAERQFRLAASALNRRRGPTIDESQRGGRRLTYCEGWEAKVTSGWLPGRHAPRCAARCGAVRATADGSDGTRTRDLRRDSAALTSRNSLHIEYSVGRCAARSSPFYASQQAAEGRIGPQREPHNVSDSCKGEHGPRLLRITQTDARNEVVSLAVATLLNPVSDPVRQRIARTRQLGAIMEVARRTGAPTPK